MKDKSCKCGPSCKCKSCACSPYAGFFDALSDESRLFILMQLRKQAKSVTQLTNETGIEQSAISHALKRLTTQGFVTAQRNGKFRMYHLTANIEPLLTLIEDHVQTHKTTLGKPCSCGGHA